MKKIPNLQFAIFSFKKGFIFTTSRGFTLIELLAVIGIFITVGVFVTNIILATLRNTNKTNAISIVQANGTYAITQMAKSIRTARSLGTSVTCGTIASPVSATSINVIGVDGQSTTYSCTTSGGKQIIASNGATLTDPNLVKWVSCAFTCGKDTPSDYPVIGVSFTLQYVSNGGGAFADQTASKSAIPFQTSVLMRNLER